MPTTEFLLRLAVQITMPMEMQLHHGKAAVLYYRYNYK
ncbi:hypothetical protein P23_3708 [Acinetobacter calcoaceticus]|nr:hypothetical protein P23_3708 [Acinetobacter calcoaceticus]